MQKSRLRKNKNRGYVREQGLSYENATPRFIVKKRKEIFMSLLSYLNEAVTPYHAVSLGSSRLKASGFEEQRLEELLARRGEESILFPCTERD